MNGVRERIEGSSETGWISSPDSGFPRGVVRNRDDIVAIEAVDHRSVAPATIYECLVRAKERYPGKTAIIALKPGGDPDAAERMDYAEYHRRVIAAANMFRSLTDGRPSVVAMMMPIVPDALVAAWAGVTAGVAVPINPHLEPALVTAILEAVEADILVTTTEHGPSAADRVDEIAASVPSLRHVFKVGSQGSDRDFGACITEHESAKLEFEPSSDREQVTMLLPTGGTTASPKLARLTNGGIVLSGWIAGAVMGSTDDEVIGLGMPLFHVGGMLMLGGRSLVLAQTVVLLSPAGFRDTGVLGNFWEIARHFGMTSLIATPTTAAALAAMDADSTGHSIKVFSSGGSTVPLELGRSFAERFGVELREVWGSTEFHGFLGCQPQAGKPLIGSVGLRTPWHDIKAVELDHENRFVREMPPGEQGVIIGAGPCLAKGYFDGSLDKSFFVENGPDGRSWGSSGDLGRVDAEGWVWIDGRAKDVIIRGGHNIDPALIEGPLSDHPSVMLAAAVGLPDAVKGELPIAYVQMRGGADFDEHALLQYCRGKIAERAACPVAIVELDEMPLTAVGKIFKPALREMATREAVGRAVEGVTGSRPAKVSFVSSRGRPTVEIDLTNIPQGDRDSALHALQGFAFETRLSSAGEGHPVG